MDLKQYKHDKGLIQDDIILGYTIAYIYEIYDNIGLSYMCDYCELWGR